MRPFRVGDKFTGRHIGETCEVIWVDPNSKFRAVVRVDSTRADETVTADVFLNHWDLIAEGALA